MAHFAELNSDNVVTRVIVVNNNVLNNQEFPESEEIGITFCKMLYGQETTWVQTSYNGNFRYNYAGIGYIFDRSAGNHGAFIAPQPFPSWILNTEKYVWNSPIPRPNDGKPYYWDEATISWIAVEDK